jgi:hypothetical protein
MIRLTRSAMFLLAVIATVAFTSCGKKWKKPTTVSYNLKLSENSSNGLVKFNSASIRVKNLIFSGERKQGQKHIEMKHIFDPLLYTSLTATQASTNIIFDIPQGTYTSIKMFLEIEGEAGSANSSLALQGYYTKNNHTIPVKFEFNSGQTFEMPARSSNGSEEIVLVEGTPVTSTLVFNPQYWFEIIPQSMLDNAQLSTNWGDTVMVISHYQNEDIYQLVIDRLAEGNEAVFNQ